MAEMLMLFVLMEDGMYGIKSMHDNGHVYI